MKSKNLRTFFVNEKEMVFNVSLFQELFKKYAWKKCISYGAYEEELANYLFVDKSTVHNWRMNVNGPGDIEKIQQLAAFWNVNYECLLVEVKRMDTNVKMDIQIKLSDREKEALKSVYKAFLAYLEEFNSTTGFLVYPDGSEYSFGKAYILYENLCKALKLEYIDLKRTLYDELEKFINEDVTYTLEKYGYDGYGEDDEYDGETPEARTTGLCLHLMEGFKNIVDKYLVG